MLNKKDLILNLILEQGKADALNLRSRAANMDGTAIIAEEEKIPMFDPNKDYSLWAVGSPVYDIVEGEHQIFTLLIPHNAAYYPDVRPNNNRTLWSIAHTKDPAKARAFIAPSGISGIYMKDEVCTDPLSSDPCRVYRSLVDENAYSPSEYPSNWEAVE